MLQHYFEGLWVVENVKPFYEPLIPATRAIGRHLFWCNFHIEPFAANDANIHGGTRQAWQEQHGIDITGYKFQDRTDKILRNCVDSRLGLHIFECAKGIPSQVAQAGLFDCHPVADR